MPILAFAEDAAHLRPTSAFLGKRLLIQVSSEARRRIEQSLAGGNVLEAPDHLDELCALAQDREADSELMLLVEATRKHGRVYVRFL